MRAFGLRHACFVPMVLAVLSCDLLTTTAPVVLTVPPLPSTWEAAWGPARFSIDWQAATEAGEIAGLHAPGAVVVADVPRLPPVAFRATPQWGASATAGAPNGPALAAGERLATAGAVWPAGLVAESRGFGRRTVAPTFAGGAVAEVVRRLLAARVDLRDFSVERLAAEVAQRLPDDPWSLDVEKVVAAVAARSMRVTYVRARAVEPVALLAPPGRWLAVSPFVDAVTGGQGWPGLPVGVSRFYSGDARRWIVGVDEEGRAWQAEATPGERAP